MKHELIGHSPPMVELNAIIVAVAPSEATILIQGESGTGKEVVARVIHQHSSRFRGPFVAVNCATLRESLAESELFGHERGAFTGAVAARPGRFEQASGGTLFLDEIGDLDPAIQAKLLRVLEEREVDRLGGVRPIPVDIRLIAATNRSLERDMRDGAFREDLYYRLNVVPIRTPALRERKQDIPALMQHFASRYGKTITFSEDVDAALQANDWPGNVRQLRNVVDYAFAIGCRGELILKHLPPNVVGASCPDSLHGQLNKLDPATVAAELIKNDGNWARAAGAIGCHPNSLHRRAKQLNLGHLFKDRRRRRSPGSDKGAA